MSYIGLNWDFSQLYRDNTARFVTITYLNQANVVLKDIYARLRAGKAAAAHAALAFQDVLAAAASITVQVEPQEWHAEYRTKGPSDKFVDVVDYPRNAQYGSFPGRDGLDS